jgi:hypothetical protein
LPTDWAPTPIIERGIVIGKSFERLIGLAVRQAIVATGWVVLSGSSRQTFRLAVNAGGSHSIQRKLKGGTSRSRPQHAESIESMRRRK